MRCAWLPLPLALMLLVPMAAAHQPVAAVEGALMVLPDGEVSWSIDGRLDGAGDRDRFRIPMPEGGRLLVKPLVPAAPGAEDHAVQALLIGPGLPEGAAEGWDEVVAADEGAEARTGEAPGERICHLGLCWWEFPGFDLDVEPGTYHVVLRSAGNATDYTLAVGYEETSPPGAPQLLPDPGEGDTASEVPEEAQQGRAPMPNALEYFYTHAFAPNAQPVLAAVLFGVPLLLMVGIALLVRRLVRRG